MEQEPIYLHSRTWRKFLNGKEHVDADVLLDWRLTLMNDLAAQENPVLQVNINFEIEATDKLLNTINLIER